MSYSDWLKIGQKKNKKIHVGKVKQESIDPGSMAAGSLAEASRKLSRVIDQGNATAKILVIGDGLFSTRLSDYAIKMGQRLDCEIVALCVFDRHCNEQRDIYDQEKDHFMKRSELGSAKFADKAISSGIKFQPITKIGNREEVVKQVLNEISGIRYLLSEPDELIGEEQSGRIQLPVIDTTSPKTQKG